MKTVLHAYNFNLNQPQDAKAYAELCARLERGPRRMKSLSVKPNSSHYRTGDNLDGQEIELETAFLFENQWNTASIGDNKIGYRLFDWAEDAIFNYRGVENLKDRRGYWLEQTDEMREIRRNTNVCGYCGKYQPAANGAVFCDKCLDSPYLEESHLHFLRLRPVDNSGYQPKLSESEKAYLMPLYREAQTRGTTECGKKRLTDLRAKIEAKYAKDAADVQTEYKGMLWLLDNGFGPNIMENCIFYNHTGKFGFGWRTPLSDLQRDALLEKEFPFPYDMKCANSKTLTAV